MTISAAAGTARSIVAHAATSSGSPKSPPTTSTLPTPAGGSADEPKGASRCAGHDVGLERVLDAARVLQRQPRLRHAQRPRQRAAAGDDIGDDRHVGAGDLLEHQDRPAPAALVLQHQRHDVVVERHGLRHAHDLAGEGALVGGYEVTDALSWHRRHRSSMTCGTNGDSLRVMSPSLSRMPTPADSWSTTQLPTTARRPSYTGSAKYCW